MKKIYFYLIPLLIIYILIWLFNVSAAPEGSAFSASAFNPFEFIEGTVFALSFGFGMHPWGAFVLIAVLLGVFYYALLAGMKAICRRCVRSA